MKKRKNTLANDISEESSVVGNQQKEEDILTQNEILEWTQDMDFEKFHLDLFEAFFLIYAINAIEIQDKVTTIKQNKIATYFYLFIYASFGL